MRSRLYAGLAVLGTAVFGISAADEPLIVVEDKGGVSALPYYRALNLQPSASQSDHTLSPPEFSVPPASPYREADMLPVHSTLLTPGVIERRVIRAPGMRPLFLVGDDERSRAWLRQRMDVLHAIVSAGPWRAEVEMELQRRALNRRKAAVKDVRAVAQREASRQMTG